MHPIKSQKIDFPEPVSGELPPIVVADGVLKVLRNKEITWLNGKIVDLIMTKRQQRMGVVLGYQIENDLEIRHHLTSWHADWLLTNQDQIPDEWQEYRIFFWGTLFVGDNKMSYVRFIEHRGKHWQDGYEPLHAGLDQKCLAACAK